MAKSFPKKTTSKTKSAASKPAQKAAPAPKAAAKPAAKAPPRKPQPIVEAKAPKRRSLPKADSPAKPPVAQASKDKGKADQADSTPANGSPTRPPAPRPAANGKPGRNQAGFNTKELAIYRTLLLEKRGELVGDMNHMESEAFQRDGGSNLSNLPIHMADMGTDNYEQEFTLGLMEKDRNLLREINSALARLQDGTFGLCEATGKPIGKARLEVQPWARYSIEHARKLEKRTGR